jgi:hypothetical protein
MKKDRLSFRAKLLALELVLIALIALFALCGYIVIEV